MAFEDFSAVFKIFSIGFVSTYLPAFLYECLNIFDLYKLFISFILPKDSLRALQQKKSDKFAKWILLATIQKLKQLLKKAASVSYCCISETKCQIYELF